LVIDDWSLVIGETMAEDTHIQDEQLEEPQPIQGRRRITPASTTVSGGATRRRYTPRRKVCQFCADKIILPDYKDIKRLQRYISDRGKILPRRRTGTCAKHQRGLATAIKRARHIALLPFVAAPTRG
jgi:small subunit ribosomal protein S18